jgi:ATP-dependent RNA helicase DeaD
MPAEVARTIHEDPIEITVGARIQVPQQFHMFYLVNARDRYEALKRLADANQIYFQ